MNTKELMSQVVKHVNPYIIKDLPAELVELSEEDLQHISGGCDCCCGGGSGSGGSGSGGSGGGNQDTVITFHDGTTIRIPPKQPRTTANNYSFVSA